MDIKNRILSVHEAIKADPNHRYRSWEHCYKYFQEKRPFNDEDKFDNEAELDLATLNLAFYLASWGMYRGSSQLLQKDYRVHKDIVQEIMNPEYKNLWNLDIGKLDESSPEIKLLSDLIEQLQKLYENIHVSPDKYVSSTDTLITKVLLGTFGCIPAYDTVFINGIKVWKKDNPAMGILKYPITLSKRNYKRSYLELARFYEEHKGAFDEAQEEINKNDSQEVAYPIMKLVDMYFWELGYSA